MVVRPVELDLDLPSSVKTDEDRLRCAVSMQRILHEQWRRFVEAGTNTHERNQEWRNRMARLSRTIVAKRKAVFPNRTEPGDDDAWDLFKAESRGDKRWDSDLIGHPVLTARDVRTLPQAPIIDPYQNFNKYTEVDTASRATVASDGLSVSVSTLDNDEEMYVYFDYGASFFAGDFTHYVEATLTAHSGASATGVFYGTSNEVDDMWNNSNFAGMDFYYQQRVYAIHRETPDFSDYDGTVQGAIALTVPHFIDYARATSTVTANIYTGSHGGVGVDTLVMDDGGDARRYAFAVNSRNAAETVRSSTYTMQNLDLQIGSYPIPGRIGGGMLELAGAGLR